MYHSHLMKQRAQERPPRTDERVLTTRGRWGRIQVFGAVVAAIAAHAATDCYGVYGMAARGLRDGVAELLRRDNVHRGVDVSETEGGLAIDVFVIVQYGVRITEVAHNLQSSVRFEVERMVGVPVIEVNVNVQGVHGDRPDR